MRCEKHINKKMIKFINEIKMSSITINNIYGMLLSVLIRKCGMEE